MRIFCGYDPRESVGFHAFVQSLLDQGTRFELTAIGGEQADGTNAFTYERFTIPERMNWSGWALFVDAADMLARVNLEELWALKDSRYAVQVVKHDYQPKNTRKYVGTNMECDNPAYPRKNWSSLMILNCGHKAHFDAREKLRSKDGKYLHRFEWLKDEQIGELPVEWNWLEEFGENEKAKLIHWTNGMPGFYHYHNAPHSREWRQAVRNALRGME